MAYEEGHGTLPSVNAVIQAMLLWLMPHAAPDTPPCSMDALITVLCCIYTLLGVVVVAGVVRHPSRKQVLVEEAALPSLSVIVPIRNEETDLPRCIAALEALDYPRDRMEVLLVDDESTDGTATLIADAVARNAHFRHLSTAGFVSPLRVKARPVDLAARHAVGDWLLITDADGAVRPMWARTMMSGAQPQDGIVAGPFIAAPSGLHGRIESLVSAFLMAFCFGLSAIGAAPPCTGPNMAIRRRIYVTGGGLTSANVFVAEDMALWELSHAQGYRTRGVFTPEATVVVTPTPSFRGLLAQHHRWLGGGLYNGPPGLKFAVKAATSVAWFATACVIAGMWHPSAMWGTAVSIRAVTDFILVKSAQRRSGVSLPLLWIPLLEIYVTVGVFVLPIVLCFSRRLTWYGDGYVEFFKPAEAATR
jgi:hypothetical protein